METVLNALGALWPRYKPALLARLDALEGAAAAIAAGELPAALRAEAEQEAHRLSGSLGTFGLHEGSILARQAEAWLKDEAGDTAQLAAIVASLRAVITQGPEARPSRPVDPRPLLLIADADGAWSEALVEAAEATGWRTARVTTTEAARRLLDEERPSAAVLDAQFARGEDQRVPLIFDLAYAPSPIPVLALGVDADLHSQLEVAQGGAAAFLPKPQTAARVIDAVKSLLEEQQAEARGRVLAVDDDPQLLGAVRVLLEGAGLEVTTAENSEQFWEALEAAPPDLVLLDVQMPGLDGIELCQVLRNDARWRSLPVIFLTSRTDPQTVLRVFALGADDFVAKPIVGPELAMRVTNRLERIRLLRRLAETDALTGVSNRQKGRQVLEHFLHLALRQDRPLSLAVLDVDHFKKVNDRHGHDAGDKVLRRVGELLRGTLRGEDVVARWGGEEFVVGLYGANKEQGVARLKGLLDALRQETFPGADGPFSVTFSAGVAQFPLDGQDVQALINAADGGLYQAKHAGRARVLAVE